MIKRDADYCEDGAGTGGTIFTSFVEKSLNQNHLTGSVACLADLGIYYNS